tara:strand:- start:3028 stop:3918 length:891 start_codon:yes stop_codon:yes gene_type:complete
MSKKILITGGGSFVARSIIDRIGDDKKYSFVCLPHEKLDLLDTQKTEECLSKGGYDVIIHTATYDAAPEFSTRDPKLVLEKNLKMFFNIARCSKYFEKMLFIGSGAEFGRENWTPKMKEEYFFENVPKDQYGLSKYVMTHHAIKSENIYNLRCFGLFGEFDDWRYRVISNMCCKAALNLPIVIKQNARFDYLYIDDFIKIIEWFIFNNPKEKVYNVCSGSVYDYISLAKMVKKVANKNLDVIIEKDGLRHEYSGDNTRLCRELSDFSFTEMTTAIEKLYFWYNKNKKMIKEDSFVY